MAVTVDVDWAHLAKKKRDRKRRELFVTIRGLNPVMLDAVATGRRFKPDTFPTTSFDIPISQSPSQSPPAPAPAQPQVQPPRSLRSTTAKQRARVVHLPPGVAAVALPTRIASDQDFNAFVELATPDADMAEENRAPATNGNEGSLDRAKEMAEYEKEQQTVKTLLNRKNKITNSLAHIEAQIADMENKYIESTPQGNILTGFDNYTKGVSSSASSRRKAGHHAQTHVFSQSSISYNILNQEAATPGSGTSTPGATPISATFGHHHKESSAGTPGSASERRHNNKDKKKGKANEDSETDSRDSKRIRTHFGASRK